MTQTLVQSISDICDNGIASLSNGKYISAVQSFCKALRCIEEMKNHLLCPCCDVDGENCLFVVNNKNNNRSTQCIHRRCCHDSTSPEYFHLDLYAIPRKKKTPLACCSPKEARVSSPQWYHEKQQQQQHLPEKEEVHLETDFSHEKENSAEAYYIHREAFRIIPTTSSAYSEGTVSAVPSTACNNNSTSSVGETPTGGGGRLTEDPSTHQQEEQTKNFDSSYNNNSTTCNEIDFNRNNKMIKVLTACVVFNLALSFFLAAEALPTTTSSNSIQKPADADSDSCCCTLNNSLRSHNDDTNQHRTTHHPQQQQYYQREEERRKKFQLKATQLYESVFQMLQGDEKSLFSFSNNNHNICIMFFLATGNNLAILYHKIGEFDCSRRCFELLQADIMFILSQKQYNNQKRNGEDNEDSDRTTTLSTVEGITGMDANLFPEETTSERKRRKKLYYDRILEEFLCNTFAHLLPKPSPAA